MLVNLFMCVLPMCVNVGTSFDVCVCACVCVCASVCLRELLMCVRVDIFF